MSETSSSKIKFLLINLGKGLLWLIVLVAVFIFIKRYVKLDFLHWLEPYFDNNFLIFSIYSVSEFFLGIIPPEFFMIWALRNGNLHDYIILILLLTIISYIAGVAGYLIGAFLNTTLYYRYVRKRFLGKYFGLLHEYGPFIIIVAAVTPVPFSAISMLVGSVNYPFGKFLFYALSRFIRFAVYAAIIWEANIF